jgi:uncharacterized phage protein (predicted DNA packaging)
MLDDVKLALRITTDQFDDEITMLIQSALLDLGIAGVITTATDSLIKLAVITYVKMHFGNPENYDRLKKSYDEQKAQLQMATGYTNWGNV